jgi:hypothetical protein
MSNKYTAKLVSDAACDVKVAPHRLGMVGHLRRATWLAWIAALAAGSAAAQSASAPTKSDNQTAYHGAINCFVANGLAHGMRVRAGDPAKASYYESKAREAHSVATILGQALGLSKAQIEDDFEGARTHEAPLMAQDDRHFRSVVADCKARELM